MKTYTLPIVAAVVGTTFGLGSTISEALFETSHFEVAGPGGTSDVEAIASDSRDGEAHVFVVNGELHSFKEMEVNSTGVHNFKFKNTGDISLKVEILRTSCKCAIPTIPEEGIPPGETADIRLEWTPKHYMEEFSATAEIKTSDPQRPVVVLKVLGPVNASVMAEPDDIVFSNISANESATANVRIRTHKPIVEFKEVVFENPDSARYFNAEVQRIEDGQEEGSRGVSFLLKVSTKPGLPHGSINQTIRFITSVQEGGLEIPIRGSVIGDLVFRSHPSLNTKSNLLDFGLVKKGDSRTAQLYLVVRGPHRNEVQMSINKDDIDPNDVLLASVGQPIESKNGKTRQFPITVEIPKGSRPVTRFGPDKERFGQIHIRTTHPVTKEITLYVRFLVEG